MNRVILILLVRKHKLSYLLTAQKYKEVDIHLLNSFGTRVLNP